MANEIDKVLSKVSLYSSMERHPQYGSFDKLIVRHACVLVFVVSLGEIVQKKRTSRISAAHYEPF